jgi:hypothetical protein
MLIAILIFNFLLAIMCFSIAWQLWLWRKALATAADALLEAERATHEMLNEAPTSIMTGQVETRHLRQSYRQLEGHLRRIQTVFGILSWSHQLMRGSRTRLRRL